MLIYSLPLFGGFATVRLPKNEYKRYGAALWILLPKYALTYLIVYL